MKRKRQIIYINLKKKIYVNWVGNKKLVSYLVPFAQQIKFKSGCLKGESKCLLVCPPLSFSAWNNIVFLSKLKTSLLYIDNIFLFSSFNTMLFFPFPFLNVIVIVYVTFHFMYHCYFIYSFYSPPTTG